MNERVRELWDQCVIKHTKTPMNWQNAADEFAELIVRECADLVDRAISDGGVDGRMVKEHFGVKE